MKQDDLKWEIKAQEDEITATMKEKQMNNKRCSIEEVKTTKRYNMGNLKWKMKAWEDEITQLWKEKVDEQIKMLDWGN